MWSPPPQKTNNSLLYQLIRTWQSLSVIFNNHFACDHYVIYDTLIRRFATKCQIFIIVICTTHVAISIDGGTNKNYMSEDVCLETKLRSNKLRPPPPRPATGIEKVFWLARHFAFFVPRDVIHVLPAWSAPGVSVFTLANKMRACHTKVIRITDTISRNEARSF
jgi:hypothetical protein